MAPVALFLVFILTFFPWVGVYPGGVADAWQNAWQATVGGYSIDPDVVVAVASVPQVHRKKRRKSPPSRAITCC